MPQPTSTVTEWAPSVSITALQQWSQLIMCDLQVMRFLFHTDPAQLCQIGSVKYAHHFGLDSFATLGEHVALQASLMHFINGVPSLSSRFWVLRPLQMFCAEQSALPDAPLRPFSETGRAQQTALRDAQPGPFSVDP